MRITICGGGNSAHVCAGYFASKPDFIVNLLTRRPGDWSESVKVTTDLSSWANRGSFIGKLNRISSDPGEVIPMAEVVLVCGPVHVHGLFADAIAPHLTAGVLIGTIFAQGGFDWIVREALRPEHLLKV